MSALPPVSRSASTLVDDTGHALARRFRWLVPVIVIGLVAGYYGATHAGAGTSVSARAPDHVMSVVMLPTPPPVLLPSPKQEPEPSKKEMIDQPRVDVVDIPQPPEPPIDEPPSLGTRLTGSGPADGFALGPQNGAGGSRIGGKGGRAGGSKFGWYASKVQNSIATAMRNNSVTRKASLSVQVSIWADAAGRVTQAKIAGSTGESDVDEALKSSVFTGLQLSDPPPADMPMPIVMRLSAKQPEHLVSK